MPYPTPTQTVTPGSNMYGLHTTSNLKNAYLYACELINTCLDAVRKTFEFDSQTWGYYKDQMPGMSPELQCKPKYDFIIEELVENNESLNHAFAYKHIIRDYLAKKIKNDTYLPCIERGDLIELLTINPDKIKDSDLRNRIEELQSKYKRTKDLYNIWMLQFDPLSADIELEKLIDITASVTGKSEEKKRILFGGYGQRLSRRERLLEFLKSYVKERNRFIQKTLKELKKCVNSSNLIFFNCQAADLLKKIIKSQEGAYSLSSSINYNKVRNKIIDYLNYHLVESMEDIIIKQSELRSKSKYSSSIYDELLRVDLYSSISYWLNQQDNYELEGFDFIINTILELLSYPPKCTNFWDENDEEKTKKLPFPASVLESFEPSTPIDLASFIAFAVYYRKLIFEDNGNIDGPFCELCTDGTISLCDLEVLNELIKEAEKPEKKLEDFPFEPAELREMHAHYTKLGKSIDNIHKLPRTDTTSYMANPDVKELVEHEFKTMLETALNVPDNYVDINIDINLSINDILSHRDQTKISINDPELLEYQIRIELCRLCSSNYIPFSYSSTDKTINDTYYHIGSETFYLTRKQVESLLASLSANPIKYEVGKRHSLEQVQTLNSCN